MKKKTKQIKVGTQYRSAAFEKDTVDKDARTVELSFSSEEPYERYFGMEILDHASAAVRLGRLNNGGALLCDHDTRDQVGVIEKAFISSDRKGRAQVRFGRSARAEEVFQDVMDGIRRNVSVSYDVHKMVLEKTELEKDWYRVTQWEPLEVSLVSVPADATVGVGRATQTNEHELTIELPDKEERKIMKKCEICGTEFENGSCPTCARATEAANAKAKEQVKLAQARVDDILAMGKKHDLMDEAQKAISEGKTVDEFKNLVIDKISVGAIKVDDGTKAGQPIYRGSAASALGQQLLDVRTMSRTDIHDRAVVTAARSRLEQTEKRNQALLESKAHQENRVAGTGGFVTGVPSDGGFFLQGETSVDLMTTGFNNSEVLSRCSSRTLSPGTQFLEIVGIDESSRADGSRGGGVRVYTTAELAALTQSKTVFNKIRIEPKKLTGMYFASSEMVANVTFLGQEMRQLFGEEFAFKCQNLVIRGTGAGEALGILEAPCLISQTKASGQPADTIVTENILAMEAKLWRESPGVCYLVNRETKPQLSTLSMAIGTGGVPVSLYKNDFYQGNRVSTLNGLPCITIEQASALGDKGDIILADLSQYVTANKGDINEAMSIHANFLYDQDTYRFICYFDGQPRWSSAVTPYKGASGATVGPFITLNARA